MALATVLLSCMHALVRHVSGDMHPFEIAFFRNLFGLVVILPLLPRAGLRGLKSGQPGLLVLRGVLGLVAMLAWFYGLSVVPIAEATALSFTAAIFGSLGAVLVLGERMRLRRWSAVFFGFVGAMIILRPGFGAVDPGALIVLFSSLCWASTLIIIKLLARTDTTIGIVAWMSIMLSVLSIFPALAVWTWPSLEQLLWLGLLGSFGTGGHLAMTQAFRLAETSAVLPLDFTRLIWASLIGFLAFAEVPDLWTWVGGAVIFGSATYIAYRESRLRRASAGTGKPSDL